MPLSGCSSGLLVTALVAVLLLPVQYLVPDLQTRTEDKETPAEQPPPSASWLDLVLSHLPSLNIIFSVFFFIFAFFTYICEWVQRKLMENRIIKLNLDLGANVERLQAWDAQQEQMEGTLKMVQTATCEYNLLLYLLLRQHRPLTGPPSPCYFDKDLEDDLSFYKNPTFDTQPVQAV